MIKCPNCDAEIEIQVKGSQQSRAAASKWDKMTESQKSREMSRRRKKGLKASR